MGVLQELIAVESRADRLKSSWQEHLDLTRLTILEQAQNQSNSRPNKLVVLGAGLLNDIPIKELAEIFKEVILVDLVFMQSTINQLKSFDNVAFVELDITANLKTLYQTVLDFKLNKNIPELNTRINSIINYVPDFFISDSSVDMVISLNLLSQLPICIEQWISKQKIDYDFSGFYKSLIKNHLEYLRRLQANRKNIVLISDTQKQILNKQNELLAYESSIQDLIVQDHFKGAELIKTWDWLLAPIGELDPDYQMKLQVSAYKGLA
jgi:hypothetical protein